MKSQNSIGVVFDDHLLFLDSFTSLMGRLGIFESVHSFNDEQDMIQFFISMNKAPVYLFLDYYLQQKHSLPLINEVKRLNKRTSIIVISSVSNPITIGNILNYNPNGIISKSSGFETILECLKTMETGRQYLCPVMREIVDTMDKLEDLPFSTRELEILQYFAQGLSISQTAEECHLSKHTIVSHRRNMMTKAKVKSITELLAFARAKELI